MSEAQNSHYLQALYGQGFTVSDSTLDPEVDFVQVLYSNGIPGSPAGGREIYASVDSASGLLEARGATSKKLDPNRTRGFTRLDQRMYPDPGGASPIVVRVTLSLESAGDGRARNTALLQVGPCRAFITDDIGGTTPGVTPGSIDCNDTSGVDWTTTESAEGLAIVAAYAASPSTLLMQAQVSGYLGNGTTDISTGSFSISGTLHIEQLGGNAPTFQSDTFLTVPEPLHRARTRDDRGARGPRATPPRYRLPTTDEGMKIEGIGAIVTSGGRSSARQRRGGSRRRTRALRSSTSAAGGRRSREVDRRRRSTVDAI